MLVHKPFTDILTTMVKLRAGVQCVVTRCCCCVVLTGVVFFASCSMVKGLPMIGGTRLTAQQAKEQVYQLGHDIVNVIPAQIADILEIDFHYQSCSDDGAPPFRAILSITVNTHPQYHNEHISDTYRSIIMKIPGFSTDVGNYHTHSPVLSKDDMIIYLPTLHVRAIRIHGPAAVHQDMRQADPDPHAVKEKGEFPYSATDFQDVTAEFLPAKKTDTPSSTQKHP